MIDAFDLTPQDVKNVQVNAYAADDNMVCYTLSPHSAAAHLACSIDSVELGLKVFQSCISLATQLPKYNVVMTHIQLSYAMQEAYGTAFHKVPEASADKPSVRFFTSRLQTPLQRLSATPGDFTHAAKVLERFAQNTASTSELRKALSNNGPQESASVADPEGLIMTATTKVPLVCFASR